MKKDLLVFTRHLSKASINPWSGRYMYKRSDQSSFDFICFGTQMTKGYLFRLPEIVAYPF